MDTNNLDTFTWKRMLFGSPAGGLCAVVFNGRMLGALSNAVANRLHAVLCGTYERRLSRLRFEIVANSR